MSTEINMRVTSTQFISEQSSEFTKEDQFTLDQTYRMIDENPTFSSEDRILMKGIARLLLMQKRSQNSNGYQEMLYNKSAYNYSRSQVKNQVSVMRDLKLTSEALMNEVMRLAQDLRVSKLAHEKNCASYSKDKETNELRNAEIRSNIKNVSFDAQPFGKKKCRAILPQEERKSASASEGDGILFPPKAELMSKMAKDPEISNYLVKNNLIDRVSTVLGGGCKTEEKVKSLVAEIVADVNEQKPLGWSTHFQEAIGLVLKHTAIKYAKTTTSPCKNSLKTSPIREDSGLLFPSKTELAHKIANDPAVSEYFSMRDSKIIHEIANDLGGRCKTKEAADQSVHLAVMKGNDNWSLQKQVEAAMLLKEAVEDSVESTTSSCDKIN